jgi:hypothetical protein
VTPRQRINLVYPNEEHELGELHLTGRRTRIAVANWNVDGMEKGTFKIVQAEPS